MLIKVMRRQFIQAVLFASCRKIS